jgi:pantetheine-phosphate adenylyltransferase
LHLNFNNPDVKRIAVFPGSFDPVTKGHENIVRRAVGLFDEIVVAIGVNSKKTGMFTTEQREEWIRTVFDDLPTVTCQTYEGLTMDFCRTVGARFMLRGVRNGGDFQYERTIAQMTKYMDSGLETVFLFTDPEFAPIHSTVVREVYKNKGDISRFIPDKITIDV